MKKILFIRFSSIGDIVLTSPVLRCTRALYPEASIDVLTKEAYAGLFTANPNITRVHVFRKGTLNPLIRQLSNEHYDHIVDLQGNIRSLVLRIKLGRPSSVFPKLNIRKYLLVRLGLNFLPDKHVVERYFQAVRKLGVFSDGKGLDFFFDRDDYDPGILLPPHFMPGYMAISNGGRHQTKIIPVEKLIELCRMLDYKMVLLGGEEDRDRGELVKKAIGDRVFNGCGRFTLMESAAILRGSLGLITGDTGLMHIGAALRRPMVSLWGNTVPAFGMYPYVPESPGIYEIAEVKDLRCRPCSKLGHEGCPEKHFRCMLDHDAVQITRVMKRLIGRNGLNEATPTPAS